MNSGTDIHTADPEHNSLIAFPVIELPGDDLDAVVHPFDAAERVLAAAS